MIADPRITEADPKAQDFSEKLAAAVADYASHPALYGYYVTDEPGNGAFPRLAAIRQKLSALDPKHLAYINLLPIHATSCIGGYPFVNDDAQFPRILKDYDEVSRLNYEIRALAPLLCILHSDAVYHVGRMPKLGHPLPKDGLVRQVEGGDAVVSYFSNAKGSRYVMIVNKDYTKGRSIIIRFRRPVRLETISPRNGQPEATPGASPERDSQETFALSFGAGEGKLFKVGELKR